MSDPEYRTSCETCRFYAVISGPRDAADPPVGECRRYPPVTESGDEEYWSHWPFVSAEMWCGEYVRLAH